MRNKFPVPDVDIRKVDKIPVLKNPLFVSGNFQVNSREYSMAVEGVGSFYAYGGREVQYCPDQKADPDWVNIYLNGPVVAAIFHQRKILNFHASSFIHNRMGIMILGETGAGKTSLTASFTLTGSGFLTDDLTPVIFRESKPFISPLTRDIKLREDTVGQLNINRKTLRAAEAGTGKQYLSMNTSEEAHSLDTIIKIEIGDTLVPNFSDPSPAERFTLLRSEICSWEILAGMPDTETDYLRQLVQVIQQVRFLRVVRPADIRITDLHKAVADYLPGLSGVV